MMTEPSRELGAILRTEWATHERLRCPQALELLCQPQPSSRPDDRSVLWLTNTQALWFIHLSYMSLASLNLFPKPALGSHQVEFLASVADVMSERW